MVARPHQPWWFRQSYHPDKPKPQDLWSSGWDFHIRYLDGVIRLGDTAPARSGSTLNYLKAQNP